MFRRTNSQVTPALRWLMVLAALAVWQCNDDDDDDDDDTGKTRFEQVNLVSDTAKYLDTSVVGDDTTIARLDSNLANPWGLAVGDGHRFWVANNRTGTSTLYDETGIRQGNAVRIPGAGGVGAPTGVVYNTTNRFAIPGGGGKALFIFAGEDGVVSAWNSGDSARTVIDRSDSGAVYKGIALARDDSRDFLYLANFRGKTVEVYDSAFQRDTTKAFRDAGIPADYGPFNVSVVGDEIFVAYAKLGPDNEDDVAGIGNGYINVFRPDGTWLRRFASQGVLNSPWAMVRVPGHFGPFQDAIFVGNFGDGIIHAYDDKGIARGQMLDSLDRVISIPGLWGLYFAGRGGAHGNGEDRLYFASGPDGESNGIFGFLLEK
jgi:uncharacterized protein (TIGR03118 family)